MNRKIIIFIITLISLSGSLVTTLALTRQRDVQLRGYVDATQNADLPFRVPLLGVNAELMQYSPDELDEQFERMQAAHITWVRQIVDWSQLEPHRGQYQWDAFDTIIEHLTRFPQLRLIVVFMHTPAWARQSTLATAPPDNPADFAAFVVQFTERYSDSIDHYQIWDEPNLIDAWGQEPRVADYVALLAEAYTAIHAADPDAMVISGGLAPTTELGPKNISDLLFLQDMYRLGAGAYFDALGAKPYGFDLPPTDRTVQQDTLNFSRVVALREEMVRNGDGSKSIWASNWGWNSLPENWVGKPSIWGQITNADQRAYTLAALERAQREWPWMAGMTLQLWQPNAAPDDPIWGFALIDQNNTPTSLWNALASRSETATAQNGLFPAANPFASYSGVWTFGKLGADIGWVQDSQLDFQFTGTDLALLLRQDNYVAYLYPTINGQPANAVPHDVDGNAYIVLKSGSYFPETNLISVASNLPNSSHTLHVVADRGWDRWALAGFAVSSGDLAAPFNTQIIIGWLVVAITAAGTFASLLQLQWLQALQRVNILVRGFNTVTQLAVGAVTSIALMVGMLLTLGDEIPNIFRREPSQLLLAIATAGLIKLQPGVILTLLAALILFIIIYNHLYLGLTLIVLWSPFFLFPVKLYLFAFPLSELLLIVTAAAWVLRLLHNLGQVRQSSVSQIRATSWREYIRVLNGVDYTVLLWLLVGAASLLWAQYRSQATTEFRVLFIESVLFYGVWRTTRLDKKHLLIILDALLVAGLLVAVISLAQFVQGQGIITAEAGARRLAGVYGSPNNVALFLGRCIPFLVAYICLPVGQSRRLCAALFMLPIGLALVLTQSVGGLFIGVPVAIVAVILLIYGKRARLPLIGLGLLAIVAFAIAIQSPRFARVLSFDEGTNFYRIRAWQSALNIIHDHPLTGLGLDQFLYAFRGHYILPDAWQEPNLSHPHNILLDFWVRLGLAGVGLLLAFQFFFWKRMQLIYQTYRQLDPIYFAVAVGAMGSMANLLSHGLVDNSIYVQDLIYVFMLLLALAASIPNVRSIDASTI